MMSQIRRWASRSLSTIEWYRRFSMARHLGAKFEPFYREMRKREQFTVEEIREYQNEHFVKIFRHAFDHVPICRDLYEKSGLAKDSICSLDDIDKLPCIDKELVRTNQEAFMADCCE